MHSNYLMPWYIVDICILSYNPLLVYIRNIKVTREGTTWISAMYINRLLEQYAKDFFAWHRMYNTTHGIKHMQP